MLQEVFGHKSENDLSTDSDMRSANLDVKYLCDVTNLRYVPSGL